MTTSTNQLTCIEATDLDLASTVALQTAVDFGSGQNIAFYSDAMAEAVFNHHLSYSPGAAQCSFTFISVEPRSADDTTPLEDSTDATYWVFDMPSQVSNPAFNQFVLSKFKLGHSVVFVANSKDTEHNNSTELFKNATMGMCV